MLITASTVRVLKPPMRLGAKRATPIARVEPRGRRGGGDWLRPCLAAVSSTCCSGRFGRSTSREMSDIGAPAEADLCRHGGETEDEDHRAQRRPVAELGQSGAGKGDAVHVGA